MSKYFLTIQMSSASRAVVNTVFSSGTLEYLEGLLKRKAPSINLHHHISYNYMLGRTQIDVIRYSDMKITHENELLAETGHTAECWSRINRMANWAHNFPQFCRTCWAYGGTHFPATREDDESYDLCGSCIGNDKPTCPRCAHPYGSEFLEYIENGGNEATYACRACGYTIDGGDYFHDIACDCGEAIAKKYAKIWEDELPF